MDAMPARWQSSQRPLFVRTVWVNGLRHAILSAEDPLIHDYPPLSTSRPNSCESSSTSRSSYRGDSVAEDELAHCLIKLQLVLGDDNVKPKPRKKNHGDKKCQEERRVSVAQAAATMIGRYHRPFVPGRVESSSEDEVEEVPEDPWEERFLPEQIQFNPLSERVLRWLDLAAERTSEEVEEKEPPPRRRASAVPTPVKPLEEHRFSLPARRQSSIPACKVDAEEVLKVNVRGLRTRRKRPMLSDDSPTTYHPTEVTSTPRPTAVVTTPSTVGPARTPTERGRPQLHIFMPALPRDVGRLVRQYAGDGDSVSDADTLWGDN